MSLALMASCAPGRTSGRSLAKSCRNVFMGLDSRSVQKDVTAFSGHHERMRRLVGWAIRLSGGQDRRPAFAEADRDVARPVAVSPKNYLVPVFQEATLLAGRQTDWILASLGGFQDATKTVGPGC